MCEHSCKIHEGDAIYIPPLKQHTQDSHVGRTSMLQNLLGNHYVLEKNANQGQIATTTT